MTWTDEQRAQRVDQALAKVRTRLVQLSPEEATGSVTVHLADGIVRKIEWRLLESLDESRGQE